MAITDGWDVPLLWHPLVFYALLTFGDRLQNPYEYKLYYYNKLDAKSISYIFAAGAVAACFTDIFSRSLTRRVGWKISGALLLAVLVESCMLKNNNDLQPLIVSKILSKVGVLSIFPLAVGQFSPRLMPTDELIMVIIGVLGVGSGLLGSLLCDVIYYDCFIMYRTAAVVLGAAFCFHWLGATSQPIKSLQEPYQVDKSVMIAALASQAALWCSSTLVEVYWSPLSTGTNIDVGMVYALYAFCHVFGGCFYNVLRMIRVTFRYAVTLSCVIGAIGMFFVAVSTYVHPKSALVVITALMAFHFSLGLLGGSLRSIRSKACVSPSAEALSRSAGRMTAVALMLLCNHNNPEDVRVVFLICFALIVLALIPVQQLARWKKTKLNDSLG